MVPQLDTSYWFSQVFWLVICLVILVLFFKKVFLPRITLSISSRDKHIQELKDKVSHMTESYAKLEKILKDVDEKKIKESQKVLNETKARCERILEEKVRIVELKSKNAVVEIKKEADKILKNLDKMIDAEIHNTTQLIVDKLFGEK